MESTSTCSSPSRVAVSPPSSRPKLASMQHRVLIYLTCYNVLDGVTLTIRKLEQEILAAGHSVCILTTVSGDPANTHLDGTHPNRKVIFMDNAVPIPFLSDEERPELSYQLGFYLSKTVKQQLDDFEPSVVHITVPDCTSLHIIQYARQKEIPLMGTYHSNIPEYMEHYPGLSWLKHVLGAFFRHQYNYLQALYVPTPYIQRHLVDDYSMDKITNLKVWGRGVDVEKFNPAYRSLEYRHNLGISDDTVIVLWVGRLVPEKRPDIFCSVVKRLTARNVKFHALVVGAGPCEPAIKALPNTTFAGWMSAEQLSIAYASSDVFLFPSAVETFGNVTLEAAASGLPVVVESGCSGHLVHDGENGYCALAGDEDAFFEATLALVEDDSMRYEFSASSREMALSLEKRTVVKQMLQNYNAVSDEFYQEYSGRHANRDSVYTQPESFTMGKYPRPLILCLAEYIFVMLFTMVWNLSSCWSWLTKLTTRPRRTRQRTASPKSKPCVPSPIVPSRHLKEKQAAIDSISPSNLSVVEMSDVEIGDIKEPLLQTDDNTATTGSSSQSSSTVQTFGDCRLSHTIAKGVVSTLQFQCRLESHVRTICCRKTVGYHGAKRKNSSMALSLQEISRPENIRGRSDATDDLLDDPQEGRVMRRTQVLDVY